MARISRSRPRPRSRTPSFPARFTRPRPRSKRPGAARCLWQLISATTSRWLEAVARTVETFGGIDILVNNASAISPTLTPDTDMKRFDLMHQINTRGTFLCSKLCLPHLARSSNGHILMISPPLNMEERWFAPHVAYSIAKYGMSLCVLGLAGELRAQGIAVNALWPRTVIDTAALQDCDGEI